jgi:serine/threonine protein kinase/tetratricopeptide (TPR) repeat protein
LNRDDDIFSEALELPAAKRAAFLDRACAGDAALRARVAALLNGYEEAAGFLENPPADFRIPPQPEEHPGDMIGRYTLIKKIGEGGCGVVYLAEQKEPVRRRVALKVIKLGMDTRAVITRFEAERQALAMMDHPDIARVFDAGATANGRPFFVMEFVDGVPITKFCDDHGLSMHARLWLFTRVCLALQHAHQKGIIHRDLKPSNILVTMQDGVPSPKVIDFGIAKATQGRLTEQTLVTGLEQFMGTPAYMSPEQAERRDLDIDTRSDVYSLGVVLYELLTGQPPHDPQSLVRAGIDEIRRIIREVDPPRPSTRVSTLNGADRATVARLRDAGPMQLTSVLRGDLDWIVMRCLEKDRNRRYGSAHELADDVRRHLRQEPVDARPPHTLYRAQKFVARNRLACVSASAIALSLIVGTVVSVRQAVRATRAERVASVERDTATAAGRAEALASADAQRRQEQAEALLTFMLGDFRTELKKLGRLELLDAVGEKAMAYFAALNPRDLTDTALARQAKALTQIGETRMDQARYPEAATAFNVAYARAAALAARHPRDGDMLFERAQAEFWIGTVARRRGDTVAEHEWAIRYRDSAVALVAIEGKKLRAQRELTSGRHNLAVLELERGDLEAARNGFLAEKVAVEEMLAANPGDTTLRFRLADVASWLGRVAETDGRYADSIAHYNELLTRMDGLIVLEPAVARWRFRLADALSLGGVVFSLTDRRTEAAAQFVRAEPMLAALRAQDPKNQQWRIAALQVRLQHVALRLPDGNASSEVADVRAQLEALVAAEPSSRVFALWLAKVWLMEARMRMHVGRPDALAAAGRAIEIGEPLLKLERASNATVGEFAQANILAGRLVAAQNQPEAAQRYWLRAVEVLAARLAQTNDWRLLDPAAQALALLGRTAEARPLVERLHRFGYRSLDPLAASILDVAP